MQDGLLFCYKASAYTPGPTPLVLRWRDEGCSRYFAAHAAALSTSSTAAGDASAEGHRYGVVLEVDAHGRLLTSDEVRRALCVCVRAWRRWLCAAQAVWTAACLVSAHALCRLLSAV